ncbi:hypothetical protein B7P43_G11698, partial [Cryptotermes secundus]
NGELHNLYSSPSIIRMIKSRRMRLAGHVAKVYEWSRKFANGVTSVEDAPRPGQEHRVVTPENTAAVEVIVRENRRVTLNEIAASSNIRGKGNSLPLLNVLMQESESHIGIGNPLPENRSGLSAKLTISPPPSRECLEFTSIACCPPSCC